MKRKILTISFFVAFVLILGFLLIHSQKMQEKKTVNIKIAGQDIKAELALSQSEQEKGLSGRKNLGEDAGMLFVFNEPAKYGFWMKDMNFPIDIIWINEDKQIVYIKKDARPEYYPEIYTPEENAKYVLEVYAGFTYVNKLKRGTSVEFTYPATQ